MIKLSCVLPGTVKYSIISCTFHTSEQFDHCSQLTRLILSYSVIIFFIFTANGFHLSEKFTPHEKLGSDQFPWLFLIF